MKNLIVEPVAKNSVCLPEILDSKQKLGFGFKKYNSDSTVDFGILIPEKYTYNKRIREITYSAKCIHEFLFGNCWQVKDAGKFKSTGTLQQWIDLFKPDKMEWCIFETEKEMFEWMAEHS